MTDYTTADEFSQLITPEMAKEMLAQNTRNRKITPSKVKEDR